MKLTNGLMDPVDGERVVIYMPDGQVKEDYTDSQGEIKIDGAPPGGVFIEFPAFFQVYLIGDDNPANNGGEVADILPESVRYSDDSIQGTEAGEAEDEPLTSFSESEEPGDEGDSSVEDEREEIYWDPDMALPSQEPVSGMPYAVGDLADPPVDHPQIYSVAGKQRVTGSNYHFALFQDLSILLVDDSGEIVLSSVHFKIEDQANKSVLEGTTTNGIIRSRLVPIAQYQLSIGHQVFEVSSTFDASRPTVIYLETPT